MGQDITRLERKREAWGGLGSKVRPLEDYKQDSDNFYSPQYLKTLEVWRDRREGAGQYRLLTFI